ncbi:MAG TPA: hypothetical protein DD727_04240 [Clostridiales bacterium]|nr:hypothetical protein [Clostridiales bacterium]
MKERPVIGRSGTFSWLDFIYPPRCAFCGEVLEPGSASHYGNNWDFAACDISAGYMQTGMSRVCTDCRGKIRVLGDFSRLGMDTFSTLHCDGMAAVFAYQGLVRHAMSRLKFHGKASVGLTFAAFLAARLARTRDLPPLDSFHGVIPIPMHRRKEARRGFNQAEMISGEFCRLTGLAHMPKILKKNRDNAKQHRSSGIVRQDNISGTFTACDPARISGHTLLLIDDVITTGSTLDEAAKVLKQAGAAFVFGAAAAAGRGELVNAAESNRNPYGHGK